jgi:PKD repeat protein
VVGVHNPGGNFVNIYGVTVDGSTPEIPDKTIGISASPGRLAIDASPFGKTAVISSEDGDTISIVDLETFSTTDQTGSQTGIDEPGDLDITANGTLALVPNTAGTTISVVSLSNPTEPRTPIEVGTSPQSVAVIDNNHAIVAMSGGGAKIVDLRTSLVVETVSDLPGIYHIAVAPWPSFTESPLLTADAGGPYSGIEGTEVTLSAEGSFGSDIATYEWDFDGDGNYESTTTSPTATHTWSDDFSHEIGLRVTDTYGQATDTASVAITNVAPSVSGVTVSINPVAVKTDVHATAAFTDAGTGDTHTASIDWGDGSTPSAGTVSESDGSGQVTGSHGYASPGLYKVTVTVTDDDGGAGSSTSSDLVVFDPNGGFVTGGGWVPVENGKATFAFVAKYKPGTATPTGQAKFKLTSAGGDFAATSFDWLVIADGTARVGGTGTIDGRGPYTFILTAVDGGKTDSIQLHAWNTDENYDTGLIALGGGSIIVHS